jgi:competence protein ComEC
VLAGVVAGLLAGPIGPLVVAVAATVVALSVGRTRMAAVAAVAVLAGAVAAQARLSVLDAGELVTMNGRRIDARATLLEPVRERQAGPAVARVRLIDGPAAGEQAVLRLRPYAYRGGQGAAGGGGAPDGGEGGTGADGAVAWPEVGDRLAVAGKVAPLGTFDAYQRRRNAHAAIEATQVTWIGRRGGVTGALDSVRRRAERALDAGLAPRESALLRGMVLGEDERLSDEERDDFQVSGLAHILAVSGQNVMLLAALVLFAGATFGVPLRTRLLLAAALIAVYVPLSGAGPSIQRAGVMGVAGLVAALAGQPSRRWYALGLAAAVTLLINPRTAGEPGWQLSFAAVAALLVGATPLREAFARRLPGPVAEAAAVSVAATLGTAPLMALYFDQVSLASLPANLLAAPAVAPVMWLGMLSAAAAQLSPALAFPFTVLAAPPLVFIRGVAHVAASAPLAAVPIRIPPIAILGAWGALIAALRRVLRRRATAAPGGHRAALARLAGIVKPAAETRAEGAGVDRGATAVGAAVHRLRWTLWRRLMALAEPEIGSRTPFPRRRRIALAAAVVTAVIVARQVTSDGATALAHGVVAVSFLDVGQGDATLIQLDGNAVLVDTGPPDGPILARLAAAHLRRLDALVLTHAEADHEGAAAKVIDAYHPRLVLDGGAGWSSPVQRALTSGPLRQTLVASREQVVAPVAGEALRLGGLRMRILWPPAPPPGWKPTGNPNDRAVVARVDAGAFSLLLTADAESNVTLPLELQPVDVLKVAHHGSADPGLPALLARLHPRLAAIEVGRHNVYGHPVPATVAALQSAVPTVVRTDRDGTVRLLAVGDRIRLERG